MEYVTKCVSRSSELEWSYWRKNPARHDASRLNSPSNHQTTQKGHHDAEHELTPRTRHRFRAKRSSFQTTTRSKDRRFAPFIKRSSATRDSFAPLLEHYRRIGMIAKRRAFDALDADRDAERGQQDSEPIPEPTEEKAN